MIERFAIQPDELPLMICPTGEVLKRPSDIEAGLCLGITTELDPSIVYDVAVVGAGPAGSLPPFMAPPRACRSLCSTSAQIVGQAGASARIENYLGFQTGISGQALVGRAFNQALKFGAEIEVTRLDCAGRHNGEPFRLEIKSGQTVRTRTVVIASGVRRRFLLGHHHRSEFMRRQVALIGGGNSAGQVVVFLASKVKHLHLVVRRDLEATMSRYLVDRIRALPNVTLNIGSEVVALEGDRAAA